MQYALDQNIAVLSLDDGKANAVGPNFIKFVNESLDRAEKDNAGAILLRGREGMFSAGFDLGEFQQGVEQGIAIPSLAKLPQIFSQQKFQSISIHTNSCTKFLHLIRTRANLSFSTNICLSEVTLHTWIWVTEGPPRIL